MSRFYQRRPRRPSLNSAPRQVIFERTGVTGDCGKGEKHVRTLKVVLVDDHGLTLEGLRLALGNTAGIELVGDTGEGRDVLELVARTQPDVVLLDVQLPDVHGLDVLRQLRKRHPGVTVVMFSGDEDNEVADEALRQGASGFVLKNIDPAELPDAIRGAVEAPATAPAAREPAPPTAEELRLTPKERQVLAQLARGLSNAEIGRAMWLSQQTVKFHLTNVYRKLGVANRTEATRFALGNELVDPPAERTTLTTT
jgi:DNA-binding NarL/FixJ family response regulator